MQDLLGINNNLLKNESKMGQNKKAILGQFMTPSTIANLMVSLFSVTTHSACRLLDPGAGMGALSSAFIDRWIVGDFAFRHIELNAYEIDKTLHEHLLDKLSNYKKFSHIGINTYLCDFIKESTDHYLALQNYFTHAILNPPYKKINSNSQHRLLLRKAGIETVNLYSAFIALSLLLLAPGGQLVAIVPRSFCNGPYYRSFREFIFNKASIKQIHLFGSRNKAFKEDKVLQENLILLERDEQQKEVIISTSTDDSLSDYTKREYPFCRIVNPGDTEKFIHIPTSQKKT